MRLKYVFLLGWSLLLFGLPKNCLAQESPRFRGELGYLYAFHEDLGITKKDWLLIPGTWSDPANYDGQAFLQSITINSWRQLSFMWGAEFIYRPVDWMQFALQGGFISGYHAVTDLQNPTLLPIEGQEGGVLLGANATADFLFSERWKVRLSYNPLVTGLGLAYDLTKQK